MRAATVAEVNEYRLRIHFDGWDDIYDDWFEADTLELYPVGWCEKTGHPLETPLSKCLSIWEKAFSCTFTVHEEIIVNLFDK